MLCLLFAVVVLTSEIAGWMGLGGRLGAPVSLPVPIAANVSAIIGVLVGVSRRNPITGTLIGLLMLLIFQRTWPSSPQWNSGATIGLSLILAVLEGRRAHDRLSGWPVESAGSASSSINSATVLDDERHRSASWRRGLEVRASELSSWFRARHPVALLSAGLFSPIVFGVELLGWNGKNQPWGPMRSISEIWWHLPAAFLVIYVPMLLMGDRMGRR